MPQGFLSMFEDPVIGPQLALGLLSTGTGLLTAQPRDVPHVLQTGIGQIGQGMLYGGKLQRKEQLAQEKLARQAATVAEIQRIYGGGAEQGVAPQGAPPPPEYTPGMGMPPFAPAAPMDAPAAPMGPPNGAPSGSRLSPETVELMKLGITSPESARLLGPIITKSMEPRKLSQVEELQQMIELAGLNKEQGQTAVRRQIDYLPTSEWEGTAEALKNHRAEKEARLARQAAAADADRDARFAFEKSKTPAAPAPTQLERELALANVAPGTPEFTEAFKRKAGLIEKPPKPPAPLTIERVLEAEGVPRDSPEWKAALKKARPGEGTANLMAQLFPNGIPDAPGVTEQAAEPDPGPGVLDAVKDAFVTPDPEKGVFGVPADAARVPAAPPPVSLGEKEDLRLETRLGPEKSAALRTMLAAVPAGKQRQAQGVLRRVATGSLGLNKAADELEALGL